MCEEKGTRARERQARVQTGAGLQLRGYVPDIDVSGRLTFIVLISADNKLHSCALSL